MVKTIALIAFLTLPCTCLAESTFIQGEIESKVVPPKEQVTPRRPPPASPTDKSDAPAVEPETLKQPTVTKEETLNAIRQIFQSQTSCSPGSGFRYGDFYFTASEADVTFQLTFSFIHLNSGNTNQTKILVRFNPANVLEFRYDGGPKLFRLHIQCKERNCIDEYDSTEGKNEKATKSELIFCEQEALHRVVRAVTHLKRFYSPAKKLPF